MRHSISTPHDQYPQLMSIDSHYPSPSHTPAFQIPHFKHKSPSVNSNITGTRIRHEPSRLHVLMTSTLHTVARTWSTRNGDMILHRHRVVVKSIPRPTRRIESPERCRLNGLRKNTRILCHFPRKIGLTRSAVQHRVVKQTFSSSNSPKSTDLLSELKCGNHDEVRVWTVQTNRSLHDQQSVFLQNLRS